MDTVEQRATTKRILVWDWPVRIGHWLLAGGFLLAWATGDSEQWRLVHALAGGTVAGVVLFRIVWGTVGTKYARFGDFVRGPHVVWAYLKSLLGDSPQHFVGHNPAAGWAIVLLLAFALLTSVSGWLTMQGMDGIGGGDWFDEAHEGLANATLALVCVHLAGVTTVSLMHRENLPRAMFSGRKNGSLADAIQRTHPLATLLLVASTAALAAVLAAA